MATLTGRTIASSYTELLKTTSASGVTGSLDTVQDGDATNSALQISTAGVKSTGTLAATGITTLSADLRLEDDAGGEYIGIGTPSAVTSYTVTLPAAVGSSGQALRTSDSSGTLEWFTPEVGDITAVTAGTNLNGGGSSGDVTLNLDTTITGLSSVTSTAFVGGLTGDVTGNVTGNVTGDLTGDVTGNVSGTSATVTGATQAAITSAANLATVGTISTGVWQGTAIDGAYVDIEGTEIKSTGESGGTKFLREDGDGTCSWQTIAGDIESVTAGTNLNGGGSSGDVTINLDTNITGDITFDTNTLAVDATNNRVGVGTSAPSRALTVDSGSIDTVALFKSSGDANAYILIEDGNTTTGPHIGAVTDDLVLRTNNSERLRVDSDGRVHVRMYNQYMQNDGTTVAGQIGNASKVNGNTDTDLALYAVGGIEFSNGGSSSPKMVLDSSGQLGLGTTVPSGILHLRDTAAQLYIQSNDGLPASIVFGDSSDASRGQIKYTSSDEIIFQNNNLNERMRIDSSGNVLVGKTATTLTTAGSRVTSGLATITASSTSTNLATNSGGAINLCNSSATDGNFSNIGGYNSNGLVTNQINFINSSHSSRTGDISFSTHNGTNLLERMRIDSSGVATITNSNSGLVIKNSGASDKEWRVGGGGSGQFQITEVGVADRLTILAGGNCGLGTAAPSGTCHIVSADSNVQLIVEGTGTNAPAKMNFKSHGTGSGIIQVQGTERLRIGSSGQLGIGGANYGTSGQVLTSNGSGSAPSWQDASGGGGGGDVSKVGTPSSGQVGYWTGDGTLAGENNLYWDASNDCLGIGVVPLSTSTLRIQTNSSNNEINFAGTDEAKIISSSSTGLTIGSNQGGGNPYIRFVQGSSETETARFNSSGYFGLGTSSPTSELEISGTGTLAKFTGTGTTTYLKITDSTSGNGNFIGATGDTLHFWTDNVKAVTIDGSQRIGLGTASPSQKLSVVDSSPTILNQSSAGDARFYSYADGGDAYMRMTTVSGVSNDWALGNDRTDGYFKISDNATLGTNDRLIIDTSGNVKVGNGSTITASTNADDFVIDKGAADTGLSILSTTTGRLYFGDAAHTDAGSIRYVHSDDSMRFETASSERMRIDSTGLGIGTSSPSYKLHSVADAANWGAYIKNENAAGYGLLVAGGKADGTTDAFQVDNVAGTTLLTLQGDGNLGVGVGSPAYKAQILDNSSDCILSIVSGGSNEASLYLGDSVATRGKIKYDNSDDSMRLHVNNAERFRIGSAGQWGIGGTVYGNSGDTFQSQGSSAPPAWGSGGEGPSDRRLKENIKDIKALDKVNQLRPVEFDWSEKGTEETGKTGHSIGLIAQEVEEVFPHLVVEKLRGIKHLNYRMLTPLLVQSVKELTEENKALRERLDAIEQKVQSL